MKSTRSEDDMKKLLCLLALSLAFSGVYAEEALGYSFSVSDKYVVTSYAYKQDYMAGVNACVDIVLSGFRDKNARIAPEDRDFIAFVNKHIGGGADFSTLQDIARKFPDEATAREFVRRYFISRTSFDSENADFDGIAINNLKARKDYFNKYFPHAASVSVTDDKATFLYEKMKSPASRETSVFQIASRSGDLDKLVHGSKYDTLFSRPSLEDARKLAGDFKMDPAAVRQVINLSDYYTFSSLSFQTLRPLESFPATLLLRDDNTAIYQVDKSIIDKYWNKSVDYYIVMDGDSAMHINASVIHEKGLIYILRNVPPRA
jgi:hypothetical protein